MRSTGITVKFLCLLCQYFNVSFSENSFQTREPFAQCPLRGLFVISLLSCGPFTVGLLTHAGQTAEENMVQCAHVLSHGCSV